MHPSSDPDSAPASHTPAPGDGKAPPFWPPRQRDPDDRNWSPSDWVI